MDGFKPVSSPMATSCKLSKVGSKPLSNPFVYWSMFGALQHLSFTRPDIAFLVNKVAHFMQAPTNEHWSVVKRILHYLKSTIQHGLFLSRHSSVLLTAYTDADCARSIDDRKFTSSYCVFLGTNLISWSSKKQCTVTRFSTEVEYRGVANAAEEVVWLQSLLHELGLSQSPPIVLCDNLGVTYLSINPFRRSHFKHVEIDTHFVQDNVANGVIDVRWALKTNLQTSLLRNHLEGGWIGDSANLETKCA